MGRVLLLLFVLVMLSSSSQLILSDYLDRPEEGRALAQVQVGGRLSFSGYFRVRPHVFSFFWFFPNPSPTAPVAAWLQGGPGGSSMFGLFSENGPFSVAANGTLVSRTVGAWTDALSMIYLDNPVGCGLSYTTNSSAFVTNEDQVGRDLFSFADQFFQIFREQKHNPFFICGESYGGKYSPAFGYELMNQIDAGNSTIRFAGVSIGDGALNPAIQFTGISSLAYYIGFADQQERLVLASYEAQITAALSQTPPDYVAAFHAFDQMLNGDFWPYGTYFHNITGLSDYFNLLSPTYPPNPYPDWIMANRDVLHVGSGITYWDYNATVEKNLVGDWMKPVTDKVSALLNRGIPMLFYTGQLDVILGTALCLDSLHALEWSGQSKWVAAPKQIWKLPTGEVGGYVKSAGALTHASVRDAGHLCPADQPGSAFDMITRFVFGKGWN